MPDYLAFSGKQLKLRAFSSDIYREILLIIDDAPENANELQGPITNGTPVTLPESGTYDGDELNVKLNGIDLVPLRDYNFVGSAPRTQVTFTFTLDGTTEEPDVVEFYKEHA